MTLTMGKTNSTKPVKNGERSLAATAIVALSSQGWRQCVNVGNDIPEAAKGF